MQSSYHRLRVPLLISILLGLLGCAALRANLDYNEALQAFRKQHYEMAESHLLSSLKQDPGNEEATSLLGWVQFKQGRIEEAETSFHEAYQRNPENVSTIEGLGWIYYSYGQNENGEKEFSRLIQYAEKHFGNPAWSEYPVNDQQFIRSIYSDANYGQGLIAKRRGRWEEARTYFEDALSQPNQFIDRDIISRELSDILFQLGECKGAVLLYKTFLSKNPKDLSLLNRYAWCLYQTGKIKEAESLFLKSKELSLSIERFNRVSLESQSFTQELYVKRIAEAHYGLALIYARQKRLAEAQEELISALKISPSFHHPEEIVRLLNLHPDWQETLRLRSLGRSLP